MTEECDRNIPPETLTDCPSNPVDFDNHLGWRWLRSDTESETDNDEFLSSDEDLRHELAEWCV